MEIIYEERMNPYSYWSWLPKDLLDYYFQHMIKPDFYRQEWSEVRASIPLFLPNGTIAVQGGTSLLRRRDGAILLGGQAVPLGSHLQRAGSHLAIQSQESLILQDVETGDVTDSTTISSAYQPYGNSNGQHLLVYGKKAVYLHCLSRIVTAEGCAQSKGNSAYPVSALYKLKYPLSQHQWKFVRTLPPEVKLIGSHQDQLYFIQEKHWTSLLYRLDPKKGPLLSLQTEFRLIGYGDHQWRITPSGDLVRFSGSVLIIYIGTTDQIRCECTQIPGGLSLVVGPQSQLLLSSSSSPHYILYA